MSQNTVPSFKSPPYIKITRRADYIAVSKEKWQARPNLVIQAKNRQDDDDTIRLGFTATKKIGGAVVRNRAKRRMREIARLIIAENGQSQHDYVFVARPTTPSCDFFVLLDDAKQALLRLSRQNNKPQSALT